MFGSISGPNLGSVIRLGYRRPLDDSDYLGDFTWDEDPDAEVTAKFDNNTIMEPSSRHGSNKSRSRSRGKGRKHNKGCFFFHHNHLVFTQFTENAEAVHAHESGGYHNEKKTFSAKNARKAATERFEYNLLQ